jgi:hypothetical protein
LSDPAADTAAIAVDASFDEWGRAATYRHAPSHRLYGAPPTDCVVMLGRADQVTEFRNIHAASPGEQIEVRQSELPECEVDGVFTITSGGRRYKVTSAPRTPEDDPERLVWIMKVVAL